MTHAEFLLRFKKRFARQSRGIHAAFERMDNSGGGGIVSPSEFRQVLHMFGYNLSDESFDGLLRSIPRAHDNAMGFNELRHFVSGGKPEKSAAAAPPTSSPRADPLGIRRRHLHHVAPGRVSPRASRPSTAPTRAVLNGRSSCNVKNAPLHAAGRNAPPTHNDVVQISPRMSWQSAAAVEQKVKGAVMQNFMELNQAFRQEDLRNTGRVLRSVFYSVLRSGLEDVALNEAEFDILADKYDPKGDGSVYYMRFLRYIMDRVTRPATAMSGESSSRAPPSMMSERQGQRACSSADGSGSGQQHEEVAQFHRAVASEWKNMRRVFKNTGTEAGIVSVRDFRGVLNHFNVTLSEAGFFRLISRYDPNGTGKIPYDTFLRATMRHAR
jgi:Ca2+-binding EF-hand superfamily protein